MYQVEYAKEIIGNIGTTIGIPSKDGVMLVGEKKVMSKLLYTSTSSKKMYKINDHVACAVAGIMSDALFLSTQLGSKCNAILMLTRSQCSLNS